MNAASSWLDSVAARDRWHAALRSRGPRIAVWVLAIALGAEAASIVTRLAGAGSTPPAQLTAAAPGPTPIDVAAIAAGHLFGAAPVAAPTGPTSAPQTTMALVLTGTIAANHPKDGMAILGPSATQARVYAVGDNVPGGARLYAVYDDHVLLDRAGRLETLALPRKFSAGSSAVPLMSNAPQNSFERVRRVISQDPGIIADVMRPQPVFADGKQRGYRVYPGRNSQAFMSLGLRPGDLVIAINNTPLDDPARGDEIFRTLSSSSEARVTVMRNGRQQDLTLNMSQIASEADQLSEEQQSGAGGAVPPPGIPGPTGPQGPD
jgi:general secretion pathway protein C